MRLRCRYFLWIILESLPWRIQRSYPNNFEIKLLGWCSDKGSWIFNALRSVCEYLLSKMKWCKFHFKDSINWRKRQLFMGKGNNPKNLLPNYCLARPPKAKRQNKLWETFIKNKKVLELSRWLKWWHDRLNVQGYEDSISNQAGAIHQVGF